MTTTLQPGDRVRLDATFLRRTHAKPRTGTVVAIEAELRPDGPCPVVLHWDDAGAFTSRVLSCNIERIKPRRQTARLVPLERNPFYDHVQWRRKA